MRSGPIVTKYLMAAKAAFNNDVERYVTELKGTNYTKHGNMRSIMSTPIAGSCRLIATPQWEFGRNCIAISQNLASRMKVCRIMKDDDGNVESTYQETSLKEGDWVIVVRPPSLSYRNTQPMKVVYWHNDCIGIHPESFSAFHGDFDGDEIQLYPVYDDESVQECEAWYIPPMSSFDKGRSAAEKIDGLPSHTDPDRGVFLEYTTLSANALANENHIATLGNHSRNKDVHVRGMRSRFNNRATEDTFVSESIRGMSDVSKQQLSQGSIGDMTRVAKIAAMCFYRPFSGGLHVVTSDGPRLILDDNICDSGVPAVRAVMAICAVAQQAALDSHRAESGSIGTHDLVADMILGQSKGYDKKGDVTSKLTLVAFSNDISRAVLDVCCPVWVYEIDGVIVTLIRHENVTIDISRYVTATYSPAVLTLCKTEGRDIVNICKAGVKLICNYYSVPISPVELSDMSYVLTYEVEASIAPITSREGLMSRNLGWVEQLLATDYSKLPALHSNHETPETSTAAMFMGNFKHLTSRDDSEQDC